MTLTTPPAVRPNSAFAPVATTWNSFTASSVTSMAARCPPTCSPKNPLLKSPPSRLMLLKTPRCPENVISSPSGPCTTETPGVSVSRSSNLRPRIGVVPMVVASSVLVAAVRDVSTVAACTVTLTVSATPDGFICGDSRSDWPTLTSTFSWTSVAKPDSLNVTV